MLISAGLSALTGAASLIGGFQDAAAAEAQGAYQARVMQNQAIVDGWNAEAARRAAKETFRAAGDVALAGQEESRDQDLAAAEQIAQVQVSQGVRGKTSQRLVASLRDLASRDRQRLAVAGRERTKQVLERGEALLADSSASESSRNANLAGSEMVVASAEAQARNAVFGGFGSALGSFADAGNTLIGYAETNPEFRTRFGFFERFAR